MVVAELASEWAASHKSLKTVHGQKRGPFYNKMQQSRSLCVNGCDKHSSSMFKSFPVGVRMGETSGVAYGSLVLKIEK